MDSDGMWAWRVPSAPLHESIARTDVPDLGAPDLAGAHDLVRELLAPEFVAVPRALKSRLYLDDTAVRIGRALHSLRRDKGRLSQRELAERAGIDPTYISKLEHAAVIPIPWQTVARVAEALGMRLSELCDSVGVLDPGAAAYMAQNAAARSFVNNAAERDLDEHGWNHLAIELNRYLTARGTPVDGDDQ